MLKNQRPIISYELNQEDTKYSALMKINDMMKIITFSRKQNEFKLISQLISDVVDFIFTSAIIPIIKTIMDDSNNYCVIISKAFLKRSCIALYSSLYMTSLNNLSIFFLKLESLKIVSMILATNVIQNDVYNLSNYFNNQPANTILFDTQLIQRIIDLISSIIAPQEVKHMAVCCLALYCKNHEYTTFCLVNQGIIDLLWSMVVENDSSGLVEKISWFFAVMVSVQMPHFVVNVHFSNIVYKEQI